MAANEGTPAPQEADDREASIAAAAAAAAEEVAKIAAATEQPAIALEGCANPACPHIEAGSGDLISKLKRCAACGDAGYWLVSQRHPQA